MSYRSETIASAINHINQQYFLPAIQREYVWKPDQIIKLFDSIMREYPISSFLFWELKPENRNKWEIYKFLETARHGGTHHNERANLNGIHNLLLILDGQQRLTSLMIGLKGQYEIKKKYKRSYSQDAWSSQELYLDLLAEPKLDDDDEGAGIYYKFAFKEKGSVPPPDSKNFWFRVGEILDFDSKQKYKNYLIEMMGSDYYKKFTTLQQITIGQNIDQLYDAIHSKDVIAYYTETDQDYDKVLDIFVRANDGGTKLSKSDLLLSMVTSSWAGMNARDEIFGFVDYINRNLTRRNNFDKDFIMKSCLVLTGLPVAYKVENFNAQNLTRIKENWHGIKNAVARGVDLVNSYGIDENNLTSVNALIPIIYYLFKNPAMTHSGSTPFEVRNVRIIRRWLIMALLKGAFGRASDGLLKDIRSCIDDINPGDDFPVAAITKIFAKTGLSTEFNDITLDDDILSRTYQQQHTFLVLSLLYDETGWGTMQYHKDHIFARNLFKGNNLPTDNLPDWIDDGERLGNLCLLLAHENIEKTDISPEEWLSSRGPGFLERHLIPADKKLWKFDRFPDFLKAREELIKTRIKSLFIL